MRGRSALALISAWGLLVGLAGLVVAGAFAAATSAAGAEVAPSPLLIEALYYDGYATSDYDEAVRIVNVSTDTVDAAGWALAKGSTATRATFPPGSLLAPGQAVWCTWRATAF